MKRFTNDDMPRIEVSVRQTAQLSATAKGHAEQQVAQYVRRAFDRLDVPYLVTYDHPPVSSDAVPGVADVADGSAGKRTQLKAWSKALPDQPAVAKDANLLLTDRSGGGIAYSHAKAGLGPAANLTEDFEMADDVARSDPRHDVFGCLHELGHMLVERPYSGHAESWGRTWNDDEVQTFYRTPRGHPNDTNLCGEWCEQPKDGYTKRDMLAFADCAREHLLVR